MQSDIPAAGYAIPACSQLPTLAPLSPCTRDLWHRELLCKDAATRGNFPATIVPKMARKAEYALRVS